MFDCSYNPNKFDVWCILGCSLNITRCFHFVVLIVHTLSRRCSMLYFRIFTYYSYDVQYTSYVFNIWSFYFYLIYATNIMEYHSTKPRILFSKKNYLSPKPRAFFVSRNEGWTFYSKCRTLSLLKKYSSTRCYLHIKVRSCFEIFIIRNTVVEWEFDFDALFVNNIWSF